MSGHKYQIIKLTRVTQAGAGMFYVPNNTFPLQQYNNIAAYCFYVSPRATHPTTRPFIENVFITDFKLSEVEIIGRGTPLQTFLTGNSIPFQAKFNEVNIPNKAINVQLNLSVQIIALGLGDFYGDVYLVLKMNNVSPSEHYKNFFKYETVKATFNRNNSDKVNEQFKLKTVASKVVGVIAEPNVNLYGIAQYSLPTGRLTIQLNNRKSIPVVMQVYNRLAFAYSTFNAYTRKVKFLELNEPLEKGAVINTMFLCNTSNIIPLFLTKVTVSIVFKLKP